MLLLAPRAAASAPLTLALKLNSERKKRQKTGHLAIHDPGDAFCYINPVLQAADREFVAREAAEAKAAADKAAAGLVLQAERAQKKRGTAEADIAQKPKDPASWN